nr:uncharacterized protein CI109_000855 [Kwoniella shandongensis]KAA5530675.1 hypothetical protein CI109_000855 [Kwoniella shandongensis]
MTLPNSTTNLLRIPPPPSLSSETTEPTLEGLLNQILTLTLKDGRIIVGVFICVDKGCNIVLREAEEFQGGAATLTRPLTGQQGEEDGEEASKREEMDRLLKANREEYWPRSEPFAGWGTGFGGRNMGMVGVKGEDVVKIEVGKEIWRGIGGKVDQEETGE